MKRFSFLIVAALAAHPSVATARQLSLWDKLAIREACGDDLRPICGTVEPGEGRVLQCVAKNRHLLSPQCTQVLDAYGDRLDAGRPAKQ